MSHDEPGLRERKRRATSIAIQQCALELANEEGLAAVTVEAVARRADISPRTFFNYFPSKEDALIGAEPTLQHDDVLDAFLADGPTGNLLHDIGTVLVHAAQGVVDNRALLQARRHLMREHPDLFSQRVAAMKHFQAELEGVVAQRIAANDGTLADDQARLRSEARLAAQIAFTTLRHAWAEWSEQGEGADLADVLTASFEQLGELVSHGAR